MKNRIAEVFLAVLIIFSLLVNNMYSEELSVKKIIFVGDSTVQTYPDNDKTRGWGQILPSYFGPKAVCKNTAMGGRSTKTFISEGRWKKVLDEKPDIIFIQFGHNDSHAKDKPESTDASTDYKEYLEKYVSEGKEIGAKIILVTPMQRRFFDQNGKIKGNLGPYAETMRTVASATNTPLIDLHQRSKELLENLGEAGSEDLFCSATDRTHFSEKGASVMAKFIMEAIQKDIPELKPYLKDQKELDMMELFDKVNGLKWKKSFEDECTVDWKQKWFLDGSLAKVENTPEGMIFSAGPNDKANDSHAVLWTKDSFKGNLKIRLEFTRLEDIPNYVNILYIQATGKGVNPYSEDITEWNDLRKVASMNTYYDNMRLLHISYAANAGKNNPNNNRDYVRARLYPRDPSGKFQDTELEPSYTDSGLFKKDVPYVFTCIKTREDLFLKVTGDGKEKIFHWDISKIKVPEAGRFGIRHMCTRIGRYKNVSIWEVSQ